MKELNSDLPFLLKRQIINELNVINRHPAFSVAPGFVFIPLHQASLLRVLKTKPVRIRGRFTVVGVEGFEPPTLPTFSRDALNHS